MLIAFVLFANPARAQLLNLIPCSQQMISTKSWQGVFGGTFTGENFSCFIAISATGAVLVNQNSCVYNDVSPRLQTMSGQLQIDRTCHVAGTISVTLDGGTAFNMTLSLWRSTDGSRLTGYQRFATGVGTPLVLSFELVAVN